ncbi:MAG: cytochrome c oxidase subunit II transmembrane domain-containing protein [Bacteroidota bacterium]
MKYEQNEAVLQVRKRLVKLLLMGLTCIMLVGVQGNAFAADAATGQALFKENCNRCHSMKLENSSTGPALLGVSERMPEGDWIYRWIKNSQKVIQEGEPYAVKLWEENNRANMDPMPHLTNADIDDIMAWINAYQPAAAPAPGDGASNTVGLEEAEGLGSLWNWVRFLVFAIVVLLVNIALQIARLRGVEFLAGVNLDKLNARLMLGFWVFGLVAAVWSTGLFRDYFILDNAASEHGQEIDQLFWTTMVVVIAVFVITNTLLFWFAYKYGKDGDRQAKYYPENYRLEMVWTVVPAIVLTFLVIMGIRTWTSVMSAPDDSKEMMAVEVNGQQWGWILRYPGNDQNFGEIDVRRIGGDNLLGVDMNADESKDDFITQDLILRKGSVIDLKIRSRDVLHSVYLPHFRVKMDAVPGMDTRFHFVATQTTQEYREYLKGNGFWSQIERMDTIKLDTFRIANRDTIAYDTTIIDTVYRYENFDFELACTEVCGRGHFSMRKKVVVLEPEEYDAWYEKASQATMYKAMRKDIDPSDEFPQLAGTEETGGSKSDIILE